jgi:hypothetical protein
MALYYLSKAVEKRENESQDHFEYPLTIKRNALLLLCQILFAMARSGDPLVDIGAMIVKYGGERICRFLAAVKVPSSIKIEDFSLEMVIELLAFTAEEYQALVTIRNSPWISNLLTRSNARLIACESSASAKKLCSDILSKIVYPSPIDSIKSVLCSIQLSITRISWTLAALSEVEDIANFWYQKGTDALEMGVLGMHFGATNMQADEPILNEQLADAMSRGIPAFFLAVLVADFMDHTGNLKPDVGTSLVSGFLPLAVLPNLAHLLSTIASRPETPISSKLKVTSDLEVVLTMQDALISTCRTLYLSSLDTCEFCFDSILNRRELNEAEFSVILPSDAGSPNFKSYQIVPCGHRKVLEKV